MEAKRREGGLGREEYFEQRARNRGKESRTKVKLRGKRGKATQEGEDGKRQIRKVFG